MKQNIVKTLLLLTLTVILFNCEKEDKLTVEDNSNNIKKTFNVSKINTAAIFSNSNVKNKLETISKTVNKQTQNKEVMSSEHGFTINTEQATYIENTATNYHSYTFPIQRPIETEYLENLVLSLQNNGTYKIALTKYNITAQEKQLILNEGAVNLKDKITITYIEDENLISNLLNKATTTEQCLVYDYSYGACDNGDTYIHGPQPFANGGMCTGSTQTIIGASYDMDCLDGISMDNGSPGSGTDSTNTGTSTNNQTDNGGADPTHIVVTAPIVLQPWQQVVSCLNIISETGSNGFTPEMATWLQAQPKGVVGQINNYIKQNECSQTAQEFAIQAIDALMNGGEVDFVEELILDSDLKDNDCLYSVYTGMGEAPTFANYLNNFDGDMSVANLKLTSSTTLSSNTNAQTSAPQNYLITITFNENNLDRPNLSIARTFIHELIHAEIFRKLLSVAQQPNLQSLTPSIVLQLKDDYPGLYDYYIRWQNNIPNGMNATSAQHQAMAQHYRGIIEQALREFDNTQTDEIYEAIAWTGLQNSIAWNSLSLTEKNSITQTITDFNNNNPNCQ